MSVGRNLRRLLAAKAHNSDPLRAALAESGSGKMVLAYYGRLTPGLDDEILDHLLHDDVTRGIIIKYRESADAAEYLKRAGGLSEHELNHLYTYTGDPQIRAALLECGHDETKLPRVRKTRESGTFDYRENYLAALGANEANGTQSTLDAPVNTEGEWTEKDWEHIYEHTKMWDKEDWRTLMDLIRTDPEETARRLLALTEAMR